MIQPRKTRPSITERLLMGRKESNQTKPMFCSFLLFSGIPFALKQAGFGLGIILLLLVAIITGKYGISHYFNLF